jgi:hypothetical protein
MIKTTKPCVTFEKIEKNTSIRETVIKHCNISCLVSPQNSYSLVTFWIHYATSEKTEKQEICSTHIMSQQHTCEFVAVSTHVCNIAIFIHKLVAPSSIADHISPIRHTATNPTRQSPVGTGLSEPVPF